MVQSYDIRSVEARKSTGFVDSFKSLFRRNRKPESGKVRSNRGEKAPIADPEPSEPSSLISTVVEQNNNVNGNDGGTGGSLGGGSGGNNAPAAAISIPGDSNRYEIRKPVRRKFSKETTSSSHNSNSKSGKLVRRKSFGRRINNLWSNFGLLKSSEKIAEFANGYGEYNYIGRQKKVKKSNWIHRNEICMARKITFSVFLWLSQVVFKCSEEFQHEKSPRPDRESNPYT